MSNESTTAPTISQSGDRRPMRSLGLVLTVPVLDGNIAYRRSVFFKMSAGLRRETAENLRRERKTVGSQQRGDIDRVTEDVKALVVDRFNSGPHVRQ